MTLFVFTGDYFQLIYLSSWTLGPASLLYFKHLLEQRKVEFKLTDTARLERVLFKEITTVRFAMQVTQLY